MGMMFLMRLFLMTYFYDDLEDALKPICLKTLEPLLMIFISQRLDDGAISCGGVDVWKMKLLNIAPMMNGIP